MVRTSQRSQNDRQFTPAALNGVDVLVVANAMHPQSRDDWEFSESTPRISAVNLLQGVLIRHGQGRVAAFGEAAMFSAQLSGPGEIELVH